MITTCTHCSARYRLDAEKVPERVIQVRCPDCQGVFTLDGTAGRQETFRDETMPDLVNGFETGSGMGFGPTSSPSPAAPAGASMIDTDPFAQGVAAPAPTAPPPAAQVETSTESRRSRRRSKEEMLARALVSDILVYNRDLRDKALAEGNLVEAMSEEIKKSWELYKDKVTPEVANSTDAFRDALNEILAEGEKVF